MRQPEQRPLALRLATPAVRIRRPGRIAAKLTATKTGLGGTAKLHRLRISRATRSWVASSTFDSSWPISNARSRRTRHGTPGTHRPDNRCSRLFGTRSEPLCISNHLGEEPAGTDLFDLHVGARAVHVRLDQRPETRGRTQAGRWISQHRLGSPKCRDRNYRHINKAGFQFDRVAAAPELLGCDQLRAASTKRFVTEVIRLRVEMHRDRIRRDCFVVRVDLDDLVGDFPEQRFGVFQIRRVETLGEPVVDFGEHRARLVALALLHQQARETCGRAQLP